MSWDILPMNLPGNVNYLSELSKDDDIQPLGDVDEIIATFQKYFSSTDFSDPKWGFITEDDFRIEVNYGGEIPLLGIMLYVRGDTTRAAYVIADFLERTGLGAFQASDGKRFSLQSAIADGKAWEAYLQRIKENPPDEAND